MVQKGSLILSKTNGAVCKVLDVTDDTIQYVSVKGSFPGKCLLSSFDDVFVIIPKTVLDDQSVRDVTIDWLNEHLPGMHEAYIDLMSFGVATEEMHQLFTRAEHVIDGSDRDIHSFLELTHEVIQQLKDLSAAFDRFPDKTKLN